MSKNVISFHMSFVNARRYQPYNDSHAVENLWHKFMLSLSAETCTIAFR